MDDKEIIDMYWKRDQKAIYYTTQKYENYCFAIAKNILTNREDSEECVNDTWLTAWNEMPPKRPNVLKLFLARITRNSAINKLKARTAKKRLGKETDFVLEELSECIGDGKDITGELEAKELEKTIGEYVGGLPEREGDIFTRRYFFTDSIKTISIRYGITPHNVSVILQRTREKLKKYLKKEGYIDE